MTFETNLRRAQDSGRRFDTVTNMTTGKQSILYLTKARNAVRERAKQDQLLQLPTILIEQVKKMAQDKILMISSEADQRNMLVSAVELVEVNGGRSAEEERELDRYRLVWGKIKAIRSYSNELESIIKETENPLEIDLELGWPD